ncbi:aminoglycoside phosphotransferase family protein [soil metagenome]|jgi:aminoglycoside phosphotransferase (APT) family kinase protein
MLFEGTHVNMPMHAHEIPISDDVVRGLITPQFPQWSSLPIRRFASSGTVNAIFRIGDDLAARFPLRMADPVEIRAWLHREADAASQLANHSPVPTPVPVSLGEPGPGYPLPWSVQTWLPGTDATVADPGGSIDFAHDLAAFIATLRTVDTGNRHFGGTNRGGDIQRHDAWVQTCLQNSEDLLDVPPLRKLWRRLRDLPRDAPDVMTHSDLIPGNVLVADGRLAGVLDGGGFGPADPALDVIAGWHLLDDEARTVFRKELGCDDLEWERSKAWAFEQSMGLIWYYADSNPVMSEMGRRTLQRIVNDSQT